VTSSTNSDYFSAICAAIGTLRGPLHGGANEAAMDLLDTMNSVEHAEKVVREKWAKKEVLMGFGHAVYKNGDPRNPIIKECSKQLSLDSSNKWANRKLFEISEKVESLMTDEKKIIPNLDF